MKKIILLCLLGIVFLCFCARKTIVRNYYLIELPQEMPSESDALYPVTVDVRDFKVARAFEQTRIALRTDRYELNYFYYHHWAVRPSYALADQVHLVLDRKQMFQRCTRGISYNPDYIITGSVMRLERSHLQERPAAHLEMRLEFRENESSLDKVDHYFDRIVTLEDKSMNEFAHKMSAILYDQALVFAAKIDSFLQAEQ